MSTRGWENATLKDVKGTRRPPLSGPKRSKYRSVKTTICGIEFDSKKEADRYLYLKAAEDSGEIVRLHIQPPFELLIATKDGRSLSVGRYYADFSYFHVGQQREFIEDVKSTATRTDLYRLKKKIVEACHGITVTEV